MKTVHLIITTLFIAFAVIQLNDPDPVLWVTLYTYFAIIGLLAYLEKNVWWWSLIGLVISVIGALYYVPHLFTWVERGMPSLVESMKADEHIEPVREMGGLLICAAVSLWYLLRSKRNA